MTTLVLIRHGESEANRQEIFAGQIDPDLQNKGLKQAEKTAEYIAGHYKIDKIYSSDLKRAYKTAQCLAKVLGLEVIKEKDLREIDAGEWEGIKFNTLADTYPDEFNMWKNNFGESRCVGGESIKQLADRIMRALTKIAEENDGKTIAAATHATPIRVVQSIIQAGGLDKADNIPWVSNASFTVIEYEKGIWKMKMVGEDKHLAELKTSFLDKVF